jgi:hypothetical protein
LSRINYEEPTYGLEESDPRYKAGSSGLKSFRQHVLNTLAEHIEKEMESKENQELSPDQRKFVAKRCHLEENSPLLNDPSMMARAYYVAEPHIAAGEDAHTNLNEQALLDFAFLTLQHPFDRTLLLGENPKLYFSISKFGREQST